MENKNQTWVGVIIIAILVIGGFWYMSTNQDKTTTLPAPVTTTTPAPATSSPVLTPKSSGVTPVVDKNMISITKDTFVPGTLTVKVGETVTWVNNDGYAHTVEAEDKTFVSKNLSTGDKYSFTFTKDGTFAYICSIHPSMKGIIVVTK